MSRLRVDQYFNPPTDELILTALDWQRSSTDWTKENGQFVPNPATYLNSRGWEDEEPGAAGQFQQEESRENLPDYVYEALEIQRKEKDAAAH